MKLWAHEWCFGAFLVVQWVRLLFAAGPLDPDALTYLALIAFNIGVIWLARRADGGWRWHVRLWFYPVAMNVAFFGMGSSVLKVTPEKVDAALAAVDVWMFGVTLSERFGMIATPVVTEILSFCYFLFFPYILFSWVYYARRGIPSLRRLMVGMFTIYGVGFLGYSLLPAGGPYPAYPNSFAEPLTGWFFTDLNASVVAGGSNGVDVFPSLHCAISCFLLFFDRRHASWRYRLYVVPCFGLWLATVYLRYHYFIDIVAGFALAFVALRLAREPSES